MQELLTLALFEAEEFLIVKYIRKVLVKERLLRKI